MTLILMWKIVGISQRLFLNGDVDICLLFFDECIPQAEWGAGTTSGRWRIIVSVTDLNKKCSRYFPPAVVMSDRNNA